MNSYICGEWSIIRGEYGIDCGLAWAIFRNGQWVVDGFKTLKSAQRHAATLGAVGPWTKEKVRYVMIKS